MPQKWFLAEYGGINRLYYIHGGKGTYTVGAKTRPFREGFLYFTPYTANFKFYSDPDDGLIHTYADFELIPPVICGDILEYYPHGDAMSEAALGVFLSGAVQNNTDGRWHIDRLRRNPELFALCMKSITYLVSHMAQVNGVVSVSDEIVISVLEEMLANLGEPFSIADAAAARFIGTDSLIRRFRRVLGVTPYAYLKALRIRTAMYLIGDGKTLEEAAEAVGYADASSLSHAMGNTGGVAGKRV